MLYFCTFWKFGLLKVINRIRFWYFFYLKTYLFTTYGQKYNFETYWKQIPKKDKESTKNFKKQENSKKHQMKIINDEK